MKKKKKVTIVDIAENLGVSVSTVSRVLQNQPGISEPTKKKVWEMASKLHYQPNNLASALRNGKSKTIGVMVPTSDRQFYASVIRGIEDVVRNEDYALIISQSDDQFLKEKKDIQALLNLRVDGIIASITKETTDFSHFEKIMNQGVPLVLFDRITESLDVNAVATDDYLGAYKAVTHLIEQGCKRIVHFAGQQHIKLFKDRLNGYLASLKDHDLPVDDQLIMESDLIFDKDELFIIGNKLAEDILKMPSLPDGIFSSSDFVALGAMKSLKKKKIKIPNQIAVVGYSNDFSSTIMDPPLSSVDQHSMQMGNMAGQLFLKQVNESGKNTTTGKTLLVPKLIIRESSVRNINRKTETVKE